MLTINMNLAELKLFIEGMPEDTILSISFPDDESELDEWEDAESVVKAGE